MVIKYQVTSKLNIQQQENCMHSIKELIKDIEDKPIKEIHANLISHLKQSILSLEECEEEIEERDKFLD